MTGSLTKVREDFFVGVSRGNPCSVVCFWCASVILYTCHGSWVYYVFLCSVCFIIDLYMNYILDNFMWFSYLGFLPRMVLTQWPKGLLRNMSEDKTPFRAALKRSRRPHTVPIPTPSTPSRFAWVNFSLSQYLGISSDLVLCDKQFQQNQ